MTPEEARGALAKRGTPYDEERAFRYVRKGDQETVALFLAAGLSPNAVDESGETLIVSAARHRRDAIGSQLLQAGADPEPLMKAISMSRERRDIWEKLSSLSGILTFTSGLVIAAVGWYFTNSYNQRQTELQAQQFKQEQSIKDQQNRLVEMQTIERMIPHLASDEQHKKAALLAITSLGSPELATRMAELFGGTGSVDALRNIADQSLLAKVQAVAALTSIASSVSSGNRTTVKAAIGVLGEVLAGKERSLVSVGNSDGTATCSGFVIDATRRLVATAGYCAPEGKPLTVRTWDGVTLPVEGVHGGRNDAVAILKVRGEVPPEIALAPSPQSVGSKVVGIGYTEERLVVMPGRVTGLGVKKDFHFSHVTEYIQIRFEESSRGGTGGGPVLGTDGKVTCMIFAGDANQEYCVPSEEIEKALEGLSSPPL